MKAITTTYMVIATFVAAFAQKLPRVQTVSLHAPVNVKVNGKADEWGEELSAYNAATEVYYTMANDAEQLYIVVKAAGGDMANRIVAGGLSFVFSGAQKNAAVITFPTYDTPDQKDNYRISIRRSISGEYPERIVSANAAILKNNVKLVRTKGLPMVDTLISVYNNFNIQAACGFDAEQNLNLEIAIPLKHLKDFINADKFAYSIRVNGGKYQPAKTMVLYFADGHTATQGEIDKAIARQNNRQSKLSAPTAFSGEYTLAK